MVSDTHDATCGRVCCPRFRLASVRSAHHVRVSASSRLTLMTERIFNTKDSCQRQGPEMPAQEPLPYYVLGKAIHGIVVRGHLT